MKTLPPNRLIEYREWPIIVSKGYSGTVRYAVHIENELHLTTDNIFHAFETIDAWVDSKIIKV